MLEEGLERVIGHYTAAAYVEIESFCIFNLVAQMEKGLVGAAPIWTDIKTFPASAFYRKVHGIIGGYPCQPFSVAGEQRGEDDPRHLWPYIAKHIDAIRPTWCLFENVANHLNIGFETVKSELQRMGYHVEAGIYSAEEVGAPHQRRRLFILAILGNPQNYRHQCRKAINSWGSRQSNSDWAQWSNIWREPERYGPQLADTYHNGHDGSQDGESLTKRNDDCQARSDNAIQSEGCSSEPHRSNVGNAKSIDKRNEGNESRKSQVETGRPSNELANTDCIDGGLSKSERRLEDSEAIRSRESMAHTSSNGSEKDLEGGQSEFSHTNELEGRVDRWPARPGEQQHEWEAPRVIEPGLGCTVNGYNFREDLLRMYGNGVVPATAERAIIHLLNKHLQ